MKIREKSPEKISGLFLSPVTKTVLGDILLTDQKFLKGILENWV